MSFYVYGTIIFGLGFILCCLLLYANKQEYLKNIGNKEVNIRLLIRENNRLKRIIENNKCDTNKDYNNIMYISSEKRIVLSGGYIKTKEQYTSDITKAKNFAKYMDDYVETKEDGE